MIIRHEALSIFKLHQNIAEAEILAPYSCKYSIYRLVFAPKTTHTSTVRVSATLFSLFACQFSQSLQETDAMINSSNSNHCKLGGNVTLVKLWRKKRPRVKLRSFGGKITFFKDWLKLAPNFKCSRSKGNWTPSIEVLKWYPKVRLFNEAGHVTSTKLWLKWVPRVKDSRSWRLVNGWMGGLGKMILMVLLNWIRTVYLSIHPQYIWLYVKIAAIAYATSRNVDVHFLYILKTTWLSFFAGTLGKSTKEECSATGAKIAQSATFCQCFIFNMDFPQKAHVIHVLFQIEIRPSQVTFLLVWPKPASMQTNGCWWLSHPFQNNSAKNGTWKII